MRWVPAPEVRVAAHPRNAGAAAAGAEWLVFVDADTTPSADLLTRYFDPLPAADVALLVGGIDDLVVESTVVSRWIAERDKLDQRWVLSHPRAPWGQTANLGVRRSAFEAAGGFDATIRWGEECDLCWRIQDAGWRLEPRLAASVDHHNRETLRALVRQMSRHGRGTEWLNERYAGSFPRPTPRALAGTARAFARDGLGALRRGEREQALFSALDLISHVAFETGRRLTNEPPR